MILKNGSHFYFLEKQNLIFIQNENNNLNHNMISNQASCHMNPFQKLFLHSQCFKSSFSSIKVIGKGGFATVYQAKCNADNKVYAIKEIKIKLNSKRFQRSKMQFETALNEIYFLSLNQSNCVVKLYHAWVEFDNKASNPKKNFISLPDDGSASKETIFNAILSISQKIRIYIQMELCDNNLANYILSEGVSGKFTGKKMLKRLEISRDIIKAVQFIHNNNMIHRDIKPGNIFIDRNGHIKLGDFGLSTFVYDPKYKGNTKTVHHSNKDIILPFHTKSLGTAQYASPEQWKTNYYNTSSDIYSLGLVLYEVLCPYSSQMEKYHNFPILKDEHTIPNSFFSSKFEVLSDLILSMVEKDFEKRPTISEVLDVIQDEIEKFESLTMRRMSDSCVQNSYCRCCEETISDEISVLSDGEEKRDFNLMLFFEDDTEGSNDDECGEENHVVDFEDFELSFKNIEIIEPL